MYVKWILAAVVLVLPPEASAAAGAAPVKVTIHELKASPDSYAMRTVRVRGQIDNCTSFTCNLCDERATQEDVATADCLALAFDGYSDRIGRPDHLARPNVNVSGTMEMAFRFATVTIDTLFDPSCLTNKDYSNPPRGQTGIQSIVICTDRATVLENARVIEVHARKSALDGLVTGYYFGDLVAPDSAGERQMKDAFHAAYPDMKDIELRVFLHAGRDFQSDPNYDSEGLGCVCRVEMCASLAHAILRRV